MTHRTTLELFMASAELAFGSRWQSDAARHLNVAVRTVQRWVAGDREIPASVLTEIADVLRSRTDQTSAMIEEIEAHQLARPSGDHPG